MGERAVAPCAWKVGAVDTGFRQAALLGGRPTVLRRGHCVLAPTSESRHPFMNLRVLIFLALLFVGLAPMLAAVVLSVPNALEMIEGFHQQTQLQNLRADFADLDQYLASRKEMVRLLAKLVPNGLFLEGIDQEGTGVNHAQQEQFVYWVNQVLRGGLDIYRVVYLDTSGKEDFRLERQEMGSPLVPVEPSQDSDDQTYFDAAASLSPERVYVGPIRLADAGGAGGPLHFLTLRMATPVVPGSDGGQGVVIIHVDMGGLPIAHPNTTWVHNDGRYLFLLGLIGYPHSAFSDYPGLDEVFRQGDLALWRGPKGERVIWVPMFATERSGPIWVGRPVEPTGIQSFLQTLQQRVLILVLILVASVLLVAHWVALRVGGFGRELTNGIGRVLRNEVGVVFRWSGPREMRDLAENLTRLAVRHEHTSQALLARARELEESNRYKSEFLANMSHELRTPLNSILLLSRILSDNDAGNLSDEQVQQTTVIHDAGSHLLGLIDGILDISKIEAKKTSFTIERIALSTVWSPLLELMDPLAKARGLTLEEVREEGLPQEITTDTEKLRQILTNFLSNAVKFTQQGGIVAGARCSDQPDAMQRPVCLYVRDTGIGIPAHKQEAIFEAFRQADGSTSRRYGGTGLGLTISRKMAQQMGARITVQSEEGQGSTFRLLLPLEFDVQGIDPSLVSYVDADMCGEPAALLSAEQGTARGETDAAALELGLARNGGVAARRRVLLIDPDVRHLLEITPILEAEGWQVTGAGDRKEALETLESEPEFDLVLLEWQVGDADCPDILRIIRQGRSSKGGAIPVIALTEPEQEELCGSCLQAGASECLVRPVGRAALHAVLERVARQ
jgi:signal transduction histidine kinase/CheY-like chemotaxis protein